MKCMYCGTELIHGGDHDGEEGDEHDIVSNLSCPKCETFVLVYHTFPKEESKQLDIFPEMWYHYCDIEHSNMEVGKGEPCNWCGKEEEDCESCT